ncbi:hypothetical protein CSB20_00100 [bacterium DOLZORAL124_64_63]|nr:MAG: hypothetical protein CSB20_00100 [bacterium DOLZORAL124_64_63]
MHDGCTGPGNSGKMMANKVRMMGFNRMPMPAPLDITCENCDTVFTMEKFEASCPECRMVYAVTPCSAHDAANVKAAGIDY